MFVSCRQYLSETFPMMKMLSRLTPYGQDTVSLYGSPSPDPFDAQCWMADGRTTAYPHPASGLELLRPDCFHPSGFYSRPEAS